MSPRHGAGERFGARQLVHLRALKVDWALRIDTLTAVMLIVVTTVSAVVHLYSIGYMQR